MIVQSDWNNGKHVPEKCPNDTSRKIKKRIESHKLKLCRGPSHCNHACSRRSISNISIYCYKKTYNSCMLYTI